MNRPLPIGERAWLRRTNTAMEARLLALLNATLEGPELTTTKILPLPARLRLLVFLAVLIAASVRRGMTVEERHDWIENEMLAIQGLPFRPFPYERHRRLLTTLLARGVAGRNEAD